jgi:hypothetical protein
MMESPQLNDLRTTLLEQTPQSKKIIAQLYNVADWTTRDYLAKALGKNRLTPHDIGLLDRLTAIGLVETKTRDRPGRIGFEYIYRLKGNVHRGINTLRRSKGT